MNAIDIFPWNDNFDTGLPEIDEQHRELVCLLNRLANHIAHHSEPLCSNRLLDDLADYAGYHFRTEEAVWHEHLPGDALELAHKKTHDDFVAKVRDLKNAEARNTDSLLAEALSFLTHWLASHILQTDRHLALVVRAVQSGMSPEDAKLRAEEQMSGVARVLIDVILSVYVKLSDTSLKLMREMVARERSSDALAETQTQLKKDVTDYRGAEQALLRESAKNQILLRNASDGIHILDLDGKVVEASDSFCVMLGYRREEVIGANASRWEAGFAAAGWPDTIRRQYRAGARCQFETRHRRKDGSVFDVEVSALPVDVDGNPVMFYSARDITLRKEAEASLRASEERYRLILQYSPTGILHYDNNLVITYCNDRLAQLLHVPHDKLVGLDMRTLRDQRIMPALRAALGGSVGIYEGEYEATHSGAHIVVAMACTPLIGKQGNTEGGIAIVEDITERRQSEENLLLAASVFANSREGIMIATPDGKIIDINDAFTEITGYEVADVLGKTPRLLRSGRHDKAFYAAMREKLKRTGSWQGEIWNRRKNGEIYPEWLTIAAATGNDGEVTHYVGTFADISRRKAAEEEIRHLAFYDPLTRLPNRRLLADRLHQAMTASARTGRGGALLFIDLDNFKSLNDTLGHDTGDELLEQVAQRLAACVREGDTVARFGGDEFVVMLEDLSENPDEAATQTENVGEKILSTLNQDYRLAGHSHHSTSSIGATLFFGHKESIEELLKQADLAMYQAKAAGRNVMRFFDPGMQALVNARVALEADLRQGMQRDEFVLYYQPQVDRDGRLTGAEALVRWQHPGRGLVSPYEFIPLAEDTGLIVPLGQWVLEMACAQLIAWARRPELAHLTIAVNVSARQFRHPNFAERVLAAIAQSGANPKRLKLEITESLLLDDIEDIIAKMIALKGEGVGFALDDFGTGYSSLAYLKRLPLDQLKIDRSFVRDVLTDPNDAAIARTVVALARSLGLAVIAEGVETTAQRDFLAGEGCHDYQGYLFGRPKPVDEIDLLPSIRLENPGR